MAQGIKISSAKEESVGTFRKPKRAIIPRRHPPIYAGLFKDRLGNRATGRLLETLRGRGRPLPQTSRAFYEPRLNQPLDHVRLHDDDHSHAMAETLQTRAFTVGNHIIFGSGQLQPDAGGGRQLMAHELTHTLQQTRIEDTQAGTLTVADARAEQAARETAVAVEVGGTRPPISHCGGLAIATEDPPAHPGQNESGIGLLWWYLLRPFGKRWREHESAEGLLFNPTLNPELSARQSNALSGLLWARHYQQSVIGREEPEFSAGLSMYGHLSGDTSPELSLASLLFPGDLNAFLGETGESALEHHPGWLIAHAVAAQAAVSGIQAGMDSDISFLSLFNAALEERLEAPRRLNRLYDINDRDDPQWSPYPFWGRPSGLSLDWSNREASSASPQSISLSAGVNLARMLSWYPESEEEREAYSGTEIFPYLSFAHQWNRAGETNPELPSTRFMLGSLFGSRGVYGEAGGGAQFTPGSELSEIYGRLGLNLRDLGPLAAAQLGTETSYRPGIGNLWRLNAGAEFNIVDTDLWNLVAGARVGGLMPSGDRPGAVDAGGRAALTYHMPLEGHQEPFDLGFDVSANWRNRDPFDAESARLFSLRSGINFMDLIQLNMEYHRRGGPEPMTGRPENDLRFLLMLGPGIFRRPSRVGTPRR